MASYSLAYKLAFVLEASTMVAPEAQLFEKLTVEPQAEFAPLLAEPLTAEH